VDRRVQGYAQSRSYADLLIDCEEDRTLRACSGCGGTSIGLVETAPTSGAGLRFLLELRKIERQSERTGDIARG
jgi:hypothetical protein